MQNWRLLLPLWAAFAPCLAAQDTPLIDNDQTRVVKVTDQPHVKSAPHEHKLNRVMIYLQAGREQFTKEGKTSSIDFKAGEVKWSPATTTHVSEIVSDAPVTMIEVEVKKTGDPAKKATAPLDPVKVDARHYRVEFENSQVRVVRVRFPPHYTAPMHEHALNRVVVYLTDQNSRLTAPDGKVDSAVHKVGEASWGGPTQHKEDNLLGTPFEAIMVEFKN